MKAAIFPFLLLVFALGCAQNQQDYHTHADFKVVLDGHTLDFNKAGYMSTPFKHRSENVHLHDFEPDVIHFHAKNVTIGEFFTSLGMQLTKDSFNDGDTTYLNTADKKIWMYVNGVANDQFDSYVPNDLDKILIYYGEGAPSQELLNSITNKACIYSKKCPVPPGFTLPQESCSVGKPCTLEGD